MILTGLRTFESRITVLGHVRGKEKDALGQKVSDMRLMNRTRAYLVVFESTEEDGHESVAF